MRLLLRTLTNARHQLSIYFARFRNRLSTTHSLHLKRLTNFLDALTKYAEEWRDEQAKPKAERRTPEVEVLTSSELMQRLGRKAEGINMLEIERYLRESKVRPPNVLYTCLVTAGGIMLYRLRGRSQDTQ